MLFKPADYACIETSAVHVEEGTQSIKFDIDKFRVVATTGMGAGPNTVFDSALCMQEISFPPASEVSEFIGEWMAIAERVSKNSRDYVVFGDAFGYCPIFYAIVPNRAIVVSDSFYGVRSGLEDLGVDLTLDLENYVTTLATDSVHFTNPSVRRTMAREISILPLDKVLLVAEGGVQIVPRSILSDSSKIVTFDEAIASGISFITQTLKNLAESSPAEKTLFLSGGVDSRLLLALCLNGDLKEEIRIRANDPRKYKSRYSQGVFTDDIRISNTLREDLGLKWYQKAASTRFEYDFRESLASFQSYSSNFSFAYSPQNGTSVADHPVLALRGGGGEILRTTNASTQIEGLIAELKSEDGFSSSSISEQLVTWYLKTSKLTNSFEHTIADFMRHTFSAYAKDSVAETMQSHYFHTRNRTHFGHTRASHMENDVSFHPLSNGFFKRAADLCSFEEQALGTVVEAIFQAAAPGLLRYPFENKSWSAKLTTEPCLRVQENDRFWENELDKLTQDDNVSVLASGWSRQERGLKNEPISDTELLEYLTRSFHLVESKFEVTMNEDLRVFHHELAEIVKNNSRLLGQTVSKVGSAVDLFFPVVQEGSVLRFTSNPHKEKLDSLRVSKPGILAIPRDGWNNISLSDFMPLLTQGIDSFIVWANPDGAQNEGMEFAFYLFRNGEKIDMKWYSQNSRAIFDADLCPGKYHASVFVRNVADKIARSKKTSYIVIGE